MAERATEQEWKEGLVMKIVSVKTQERWEECFQRCYEEGYDLTDGERYNLWIKTYHPEGL